jgi:hypothetical protein
MEVSQIRQLSIGTELLYQPADVVAAFPAALVAGDVEGRPWLSP